MRSVTRHSNVPDSANEIAQLPASEEPVAHPKIARRPSQWKRAAQSTEKPVTSNAPLPTRNLSWQDDARFGIWMVIAIAVLNIALTYTSSTPRSDAKPSLMVQQLTHASPLPTPVTDNQANIRTFTTPKEVSDLSDDNIRSFLDERARLLEEMGSPAPRASSFEPRNDQ